MIHAIRRWWRSRHRWNYHNPYERTCDICGRREVQHCADIKHFYNAFKGWWEVWDRGDPGLHHKETK